MVIIPALSKLIKPLKQNAFFYIGDIFNQILSLDSSDESGTYIILYHKTFNFVLQPGLNNTQNTLYKSAQKFIFFLIFTEAQEEVTKLKVEVETCKQDKEKVYR